MVVKTFAAVLAIFVLSANAQGEDYKYDPLAGGWLKLFQAASWTDASIRCDSDGGVLASPVNSQIRDAIRNFLGREGRSGLHVLSGVRAEYNGGDYLSVEGVSLQKMPVIFDSTASPVFDSGDSCIKWMTSQDEVLAVKCAEKLPFVCFKKRHTVVVKGCGIQDPEYKYYELSGSCYKFHNKGETWPQAYAQCKKENGYLAVINSPLEHRVLKDLFAKYSAKSIQYSAQANGDYALLGFRDWQDGQSWKTVLGQTLEQAGFGTWAAGEPNNGHGNEHCGSLYRQGGLNDLDCDYKFAYICEKNPELFYK